MAVANRKQTATIRRFVNMEPVGGWPKTGLATAAQAKAFLAIRRSKYTEALAKGHLKPIAHPMFPGNWFDWEDLWAIAKSK